MNVDSSLLSDSGHGDYWHDKPTNQSPAEAELKNLILAVINGADEVARVTTGLADEKYIAHQEALIVGFTKLFTQHHQALLQKIEEAMPKKKDTHPMEDGVPVETYGYEEEYNSAIDQVQNILNQAREGKL